jgi:hypothetical protein
MLSQLTYFGSIISPSQENIKKCDQIFKKFIIQNLKISEKDIALPVNKGGLGFFDTNQFLKSLQCAWVKKAFRSTIDCWRQDLNSLTGMLTVNVDPDRIDADTNPVLKEVSSAFYEFKRGFHLINDNFLQSSITGNPNLVQEKRFAVPVGDKFWDTVLSNPHADLTTICIRDMITDTGRVKNIQSLSNVLSTVLERDNYNTIKKVVETSIYVCNRDKVIYNHSNDGSISEFVTRFKKGSRNFRNIFAKTSAGKVTSSKNKKIKTFFQLVNVNILPDPDLEKFNSEWAKGFYPMKLRDFIYKFRNNILGINTRVSHFANNVSRTCTFCAIANPRAAVDETFCHLFFDCKSTNDTIKSFIRKFMFDYGPLTDQDLKKFIFTGTNAVSNKIDNAFICALSVTICFYIWECKLQKKLPSAESLANDIFYNIENMRKASNQIRHDMDLRLHICRNWSEQTGRRH